MISFASFADLVPFVPKRIICALKTGKSLKSARKEANVENAQLGYFQLSLNDNAISYNRKSANLDNIAP